MATEELREARAEVERLQRQVAALLELFTYSPYDGPNRERLYCRVHGDADVTDDVAAILEATE